MSDICRKRKELCLLLGMFIILASQSGGNAKSSCSRSVKKLKLPPHTKFAKSQKNARETKILCDKGYFFSKGKSEAVIKCRKGVIAKPIPACRGCNPPPKINNGTTKFSSTSVGSKVRYSCDVGYTLVGRRQRRCGKNFKWSGREKTYCRRNKCLKPRLVIRNGNVTTSDPSYYDFATLSFECKEGYELLGEEDIVCRNNKWSSNRFPLCRRKRCPNPGQPNNGRRFGSQFYIGSTVEFFCNSGYKLYGSSKRTCQKDQTWNGTLTICDDGRSHCRDPGTPIGAIRDGKLYNIGNIVKYRCKPGFKLVGSSNRTCKRNKNWSGIQPKCVDENYREFPPINETAIRLQEGFVGSLLQVTCSGTNVSCPKIDARARALNLKYKEGLDLIFVLDASSSIKTENFNTAKGFLKEIVEIFGISDRPDGTRIACVTYGTKANVEFTFNADSVSTKDKALKRIDKISYTRGGTATRLALNEVEKTILPSARKGSVKALFIITDGNSNIGGKPKKAAEVLKRKKVEIYVVGIGKKVTQESLYDLASEPKKEHVFNIKAYKDLKKVRRKIVVPPDYSRCGYPYYKPKDSRARIVGGRESRESDWPWAVRIFVKGSHVCGGALIKDEWVLTAAHCFNNEHYSQVQIVFNNEKGTVKTSTKYVIHQDYDGKIFKNDIALVKFPKLARFDRRRQPICLPKEIDMSKIIQSGNKLHAVGWGGTKKVGKGKFANSKDYSKVLKEVDIPFTQDKDCAEKVRQMVSQGRRDWYFNNVTQFCAGDKSGKVDTCQGDSGGPALVLHNDPVKNKLRWYQIGIVSWGHGCAQKGEYGFYTKVSAFLSWIDNEIKK